MIAQAVIGANYGDEGKGVITDYLVNKSQTLCVVRFNGGAQAGHTVKTPDGKEHVFRHFSSGSFSGAWTFLSKYFVINPMLYFKEINEISRVLPNVPRLLVDPRAYVTTPWDIMVNQAREEAAGKSRLGSCGVGHRDTVDRNEYSEERFGFNIHDVILEFPIQGIHRLSDKLEFIRTEWVPERLEEYKVPYTKELREIVMSDEIMKRYLEDLQVLASNITLVDTCDITAYGNIIFEGSQGLGLDQDRGTVPHTTRSNTGVKNILDICKEAEIEAVEVYYTTRAYLTRHGPGPMESEFPDPTWMPKGWEDASNLTNEFQGKMRYGFLDVDELARRIKDDLRVGAFHATKIFPKLAITCLDQLEAKTELFVDGLLVKVDKEEVASFIAHEVGICQILESYGPTRGTVREVIV